MNIGDKVYQKFNIFECNDALIGTVVSNQNGYLYVQFEEDDSYGWPYLEDELVKVVD